MEERSTVFGSDAARYDRARPRYPTDLIDAVVAHAGEQRRVLEVGCGTGIATRQLVAAGAHVTALDPDERMLEVARRRSGPAVTFLSGRFESWAPSQPAHSYDAVAAGQAWHWVEGEIGFRQASHLLVPGGALALFWNRPHPGGFEFQEGLDELYANHAPEIRAGLGSPTRRFVSGAGLEVPDEFEVHEPRRFRWSTRLTTHEYLDLLGTHSNHILLPEARRSALFGEIGSLIDGRGGTIETRYESVLVVAVKPRPAGG